MISIPMGNVPMGTIIACALKLGIDPTTKKQIPPPGWLICDGSSIPTKYTELIQAIGSKTPNLAGRTLIGTGTPDASQKQSDGRSTGYFPPSNPAISELPLGYTGGEYVHVLQENEMPAHTHNFTGYNTNYRRAGDNNADSGDDISAADCYCWGTESTSVTGSNYAHNNMQPYYTVNFIIYTGHDS